MWYLTKKIIWKCYLHRTTSCRLLTTYVLLYKFRTMKHWTKNFCSFCLESFGSQKIKIIRLKGTNGMLVSTRSVFDRDGHLWIGHFSYWKSLIVITVHNKLIMERQFKRVICEFKHYWDNWNHGNCNQRSHYLTYTPF